MKKLVVRGFAAVGVLIVLAVGGVAGKFYVMSPRMRAAPQMKAPSTPEAIERGRYLATHVAACVGCHSKVDEGQSGEPVVPGMLGSGRDFGMIPNFPGHLRAPNLTPDKKHGIGDWTDGEVVRAMREGVSRDGRALFPQMPYQTYAQTLSDEDALSIVAYLRTLAPVDNDPGPMEVKFPVSMFIRGAPAPLDRSAAAAPPPSDKKARGEWLLQVCSCGDCHDKHDDKMNRIEPFSGGMRFDLPNGKGSVYAANITSDPATGIGTYSEEDIRRVIDTGVGKSGRTLYVMPWKYYSGMTQEDRDALVFALKAVPAKVNAVPPSSVK